MRKHCTPAGDLPGVGQLRQAARLPLGPARPLLAFLGEVQLAGQQLRVGAVRHLRGRGDDRGGEESETDRLAAHGGVVLVLQEGRDQGGGRPEVEVAPSDGQWSGVRHCHHARIDIVRTIHCATSISPNQSVMIIFC